MRDDLCTYESDDDDDDSTVAAAAAGDGAVPAAELLPLAEDSRRYLHSLYCEHSSRNLLTFLPQMVGLVLSWYLRVGYQFDDLGWWGLIEQVARLFDLIPPSHQVLPECLIFRIMICPWAVMRAFQIR